MDLQPTQRRVLVSGGSHGIGRVVVEHFLAEGAEMALCTRGEAGMAEAANCSGERVFDMSMDTTDPQQMHDWAARSTLHLGDIDIAVPSVSALASGGDPDTWRRAFETDLLGSVGTAAAALPWSKRSEAALMVPISSVSGREVDMFAEPYDALEAALVYYGKTLVSHYAKGDIQINTVLSGNVYFEDGVRGAIERDSSETFTRCLAANPMGCMARPDEVARVVLFLASPAASFTTGTNLLVDGGPTQDAQF